MLNLDKAQLVDRDIGVSLSKEIGLREGIVLRPATEEFDETLEGRLSFKIINPQFLLKFDE